MQLLVFFVAAGCHGIRILFMILLAVSFCLPPAVGARHILFDNRPHSPFLNMAEDAWSFISNEVNQLTAASPEVLNGRMLRQYVHTAVSKIQIAHLNNWWLKLLTFVNDCLQDHVIDASVHVNLDWFGDEKMAVQDPAIAARTPWPFFHIRKFKNEVQAENIVADVTTATGKVSKFKKRRITGAGEQMVFSPSMSKGESKDTKNG